MRPPKNRQIGRVLDPSWTLKKTCVNWTARARLAFHSSADRIQEIMASVKGVLIPNVNEALGGISRITFQTGVSTLPSEEMLDAIEILGAVVAPIVPERARPHRCTRP